MNLWARLYYRKLQSLLSFGNQNTVQDTHIPNPIDKLQENDFSSINKEYETTMDANEILKKLLEGNK